MYNGVYHKDRHSLASTVTVIMPKVSDYTRTRIELLYKQDLHPAEIFKLLKKEGQLVSFASAKNTKLCGDKTHRNREVPGGSKIEIRSMLPYFYVSIIY